MSGIEIKESVREHTERVTFTRALVPGYSSKIVAYEVTTETVRDGNVLKSAVIEGLAFEPNFKRYMSSCLVEHLHKQLKFKDSHGNNHYYLALVSQEFLSRCAREGYGYVTQDRKFLDKESTIARHPLKALASGKPYVLVIDRGGWDHSMRYVDDINRHYANAFQFDYIDSNMNSTNYDLEKVLKILSKRARVRAYPRKQKPCRELGSPVSLRDMSEKERKSLIRTIPYYNNDSGVDTCLDFKWEPTQKEMDTLVAENLKEKGYNRFKVIFDLDMLGLRKGGAAKFETFHGEYGHG